MQVKSIVALALLVIAALCASAAARPSLLMSSEERIFALAEGPNMAAKLEDEQYLDFLRKALGSLDVFGTNTHGEIELKGTPGHATLFKSLGFNVTDITMRKQQEHHDLWASSPVCNLGAQACAEQSADDFFSKYQTLDSIFARLDKVIRENPTLASGFSLGNSYEGRPQRAVWLTGTGGGRPEDKPVVFLFTGEHCREWLPVMGSMYWIEQLVSLYPSNTRVRALMDRFRFAIMPVMNPDGYVYSMTVNSMWRKSRKPNPGSSCVGTDLNRNWPFRWNTGGSSGDRCSEVYHGERPMDNIETQNVYNFADRYRPFFALDCHAYGNMWMHAWGYTYDYPSHNAQLQRCGDATRDAIRSVHGQTFRTGTISRVVYVASGSSVDTFYGQMGMVWSYAAEVRGNSFQPPVSNIKPSNEELWAGILANIECAAQSM